MRSHPPARPSVRLLAVLVALVLVLLAACGGDDDGGSDEATGDDVTTTTEDTGTTAADDGEDSGDEPSNDSEVCQAAQRLSDLDDESQGVINESLQQVMALAGSGDQAAAEAAFDDALDEVQAFVQDRLPEVLDAYDDLAATVPGELEADVITLRDFTEDLVRAIADADSIEDMQAAVTERQDEINQVSEAVLRLDEFTQKECGIVLAD